MSSVLLTSDVTEVYMVHPDDMPQADEEGGGGGLEAPAVISKYDTREVKGADGTEYYLVEHKSVKDLLNRQKVPMGLIKKSDAKEVSAHNWEAFGFKAQSITPKEFVFGKADHAFLNEVWKALKSDEKSDENCDIPTVKKLISREEGCFKLSRWVCQHASEWADEADFKSQVKTFLEENAKEDDDAKAKAKAKYERLEAKIANLSWWKDVKAEGFPSSSTVYHFHPVAFLEQMKRVEKYRDIDLSDPDKWISQFTRPNASMACHDTSVLVLKAYGVTGGAKGNVVSGKKYANGTAVYDNTIQTVIQMKDGTLMSSGREQEGIEYLDEQLELGKPIVVGLDDERNETYNSDKTTEHFVVITGRLTDMEGKLYYRFFEVGTNVINKTKWGISEENKLYLEMNKWLQGKKRNVQPNRQYTVTQIRKNI